MLESWSPATVRDNEPPVKQARTNCRTPSDTVHSAEATTAQSGDAPVWAKRIFRHWPRPFLNGDQRVYGA
jgi:hypothetical protein